MAATIKWRPGAGELPVEPRLAVVVGCGHVMGDAAQRKVAPLLVDLEVEIEVRPLHACVRVDRLLARLDRRHVGEIEQRFAAHIVGTYRERHAVAQLRGVGDCVDATPAGVSVVLLPYVVALTDIPGVRERLGMAEGKACPLDERARWMAAD